MFDKVLRKALMDIGVECIKCKDKIGAHYQKTEEYLGLRRMRDLMLTQIMSRHRRLFKKDQKIETDH
jgi:hypothetical protein